MSAKEIRRLPYRKTPVAVRYTDEKGNQKTEICFGKRVCNLFWKHRPEPLFLEHPAGSSRFCKIVDPVFERECAYVTVEAP